jgi:hypothetical protein
MALRPLLVDSLDFALQGIAEQVQSSRDIVGVRELSGIGSGFHVH